LIDGNFGYVAKAATFGRLVTYHLTLIDGIWLLVVRCHSRRCVRAFAVQRIRSLRPTGATFSRPADFHTPVYLRRRFRSLRGDS
jgi:predicted DNA-binding transcriptional regulator YafY